MNLLRKKEKQRTNTTPKAARAGIIIEEEAF
jgi:hypothetical protein